MPRVIEESWDLTSADWTSIPTGTTYRNNGVDTKWTDIWKYQVPTGVAHILKPSHHFAVYLDETGGSDEVDPPVARVKLEVRDQSEADSKTIFGPTIYARCKTFDDISKMATLDLQSDISVEEKFWIVVMVYNASGTTTKVAYCYFNLETVRVRSGI